MEAQAAREGPQKGVLPDYAQQWVEAQKEWYLPYTEEYARELEKGRKALQQYKDDAVRAAQMVDQQSRLQHALFGPDGAGARAADVEAGRAVPVDRHEQQAVLRHGQQHDHVAGQAQGRGVGVQPAERQDPAERQGRAAEENWPRSRARWSS